MGFLDKIFKGGKGNGNSKPSNGNSTYIYRDIYNIFFSEEDEQPTVVESINETIEQVVDVLGDNAPTTENKKGEIKKLDIEACELIYQENLQKVAEILAGIQSEVPKNEYTKFRKFYRNLLEELPLGEVDLQGFKEELMLFTGLPAEIKKTKRSLELSDEIKKDNAKNGKRDPNARRYVKLDEQKKTAMPVMEKRYGECEQNLKNFMRYHIELSDFIVDVFKKVEEVYKKEGLDSAIDFTEALYFPVQGKRVLNPLKNNYMKQIIFQTNKKSGEEINEIACKVNKILTSKYGGVIDYKTIKYSIDTATLELERSKTTVQGE